MVQPLLRLESKSASRQKFASAYLIDSGGIGPECRPFCTQNIEIISISTINVGGLTLIVEKHIGLNSVYLLGMCWKI